MKTLIVENDVMTQCLLAKTLTERGHEVVAFENAEQAVLAYQREFYPLIFVDAGLPGMGGLQFCRWVRSQPSGHKVYILVAASPGKPADLREIIDAGANDFVMRPLETTSLHVRLAVAEQQMKAFFDRKEVEEALQQSTERLDQWLNLTSEAVWVMDASSRTTAVNSRLEEMLGYHTEELSRHSVLDLCAEESCERVAEILARVADGNETRTEVVFRPKSGGRKSVYATVAPLPAVDGAPTGAVWILQDLTNLQEKEAALAKAREDHAAEAKELRGDSERLEAALQEAKAVGLELRERLDRAETELESAARRFADEKTSLEASVESQRIACEAGLAREAELAGKLAQREADAAAERKQWEAKLDASQQDRECAEAELEAVRQRLAAVERDHQSALEAHQAVAGSRAELAAELERALKESESSRLDWERRLAEQEASLAEEKGRTEAAIRSLEEFAGKHEQAVAKLEKAVREAREERDRRGQEADASGQEARRLQVECEALTETRQREGEEARKALAERESEVQRLTDELRGVREEQDRFGQEAETFRQEARRLQGECDALTEARQREGNEARKAEADWESERERLQSEVRRVREEREESQRQAAMELGRLRGELEAERAKLASMEAAHQEAQAAAAAQTKSQAEELAARQQELKAAFEEQRALQQAVIEARGEVAEGLRKHAQELLSLGEELRAVIAARVRGEEASAALLSEAEGRANQAQREREQLREELQAARAQAEQQGQAEIEAKRRCEQLERECVAERLERERLEAQLQSAEALARAGSAEEGARLREELQRQQAKLAELSAERAELGGRVEDIRQMNKRLQEELSLARAETERAGRFLDLIVDLRGARTPEALGRGLASASRAIVSWTGCRFDLQDRRTGRVSPVVELAADAGDVQPVAGSSAFPELSPEIERLQMEGVQVVRGAEGTDGGGEGTMLCLAVPGHPEVVGCLRLRADNKGGWDPSRLRALEDLARCAAFAMERMAGEEVRLATEQRLATISKLTAEVLWDWEISSGRLWRNEAFESVFGYHPQEVSDGVQFFEDRVHPEDLERVLASVRACLENRDETWRSEYRFRRADGTYAHVQDRGIVVRDSQGAAVRMVGAMVDVSQRKAVEEAMIEGQARKGAILESALDAIITIDHEGRVFEWNPTAERMFGHRRADVLGKELVQLIIPPGARVRHQEEFTRHLADGGSAVVGRRVEFAAIRADGSEFPVELSLSRIPTEGNPIYTGFIRDFTERRRAEQEIQKLAAFPRWNPNPVFEIAADGRLNYCNDAARQMAAALGRNEPAGLLPESVGEVVRECLREGQSKLRQETHLNGRTLSWSFFPILSGGVVHCYATDITERVNLEQQLRHSQKMESVGQLAAGVAHDFNNLLSIIQGYSVSLQEEKWLPADASEALNQIYSAAQRAAHLTRQLLTFSRRSTLHIQTLDLNDTISNVSKLLRRVLGEHVELTLDLSPALPAVEADVGMMEQVVMNLALNARDAMPGGGRLSVATRPAEVTRSHAQQNPEASTGTHVCLEVRDSGCGMDATTRERVFEPFFTTKPAGKGTGLGLATVYGIVKQHRGWIELESQVGQGTTFRIYLPASRRVAGGERSANPGVSSSTEVAAKGTETILVVEDEPAVLAMAKGVLQRQGYRVIGAPSGDEAISIWQKHGGEIDLLVTDVVMPGTINGRVLAQKLQDGKPGLKVIYTSGYGTEILGPEVTRSESCSFLSKPYHPDTLTQMVRDSLDNRELAAC